MDLEHLYREHRERVLVWATLRGVPEADVEDVAHEAFAALARSPSPPQSIPAWLRGATFVLARRHRDRARRRREVDVDYEHVSPAPTPEADLGAEEVRGSLLALVGRLEDARRDVLVRHVLEDEPIESIAVRQGVPFETARKRLRLARADLREAIERSRARERRTAGSASFGFLFALERRWKVGGLVAAVTVVAVLVPRAPELGPTDEDPVDVTDTEEVLGLRVAVSGVDAPHEEGRTRSTSRTISAPTAPPLQSPSPVVQELPEAELLTLARRAIEGGAPRRAEAFLQRHARAYPSGALAPERGVLLARAAAAR